MFWLVPRLGAPPRHALSLYPGVAPSLPHLLLGPRLPAHRVRVPGGAEGSSRIRGDVRDTVTCTRGSSHEATVMAASASWETRYSASVTAWGAGGPELRGLDPSAARRLGSHPYLPRGVALDTPSFPGPFPGHRAGAHTLPPHGSSMDRLGKLLGGPGVVLVYLLSPSLKLSPSNTVSWPVLFSGLQAGVSPTWLAE